MPKDYCEMQRQCAALAENASPETKAILEQMRAEFVANKPARISRFPLTIPQSLVLLLAIFGPAFAGTGFAVWYFDPVPKGRIVIQLTPELFEKWAGHAAFSRQQELLDALDAEGDDPKVVDDKRSPVLVYEDGWRLGPAHSTFVNIRDLGAGRFSHWKGYGIVFSAGDNSDPKTNGKRYWVVVK